MIHQFDNPWVHRRVPGEEGAARARGRRGGPWPTVARCGLLLGLAVSLGACASPDDKATDKFIYASGRPVYQSGGVDDESIVKTVWEAGEYGYVRIVRAEPGGGGNRHPVNVAPEQVRAALSQLQLRKGDDTEAVFNDTELEALSDPVAKALGQAGPDQDVIFAVSARKGALKLMQPLSVTTGRLFFKDGQVNVIFGKINDVFGSELRATGVLEPFTPGTRGREADLGPELAAVGPVQFASGREDWVRISGDSPAPAPQSAPSGFFGSGAQQATAPQPGFYQSAPTPQPQSGFTQPAPAPRQDTSRAYIGEDDRYRTIEERLRVLQNLHRQGLITDQEYQSKRRAIIGEL